MRQRVEQVRAASASCVWSLMALLIAAAMMHGCASAARTAPPRAADASAHESLVLPSTVMLNQERGGAVDAAAVPWEFWRNNGVINYQPYGAAYPHGWSETYTRDRFFTFDGRPHDHSRYEIRSYRAR